MPQLLSIRDFCDAAGISAASYHRLVNAGQGPILTRIGRRVFVSDADAAAWLLARRQTSEAGK